MALASETADKNSKRLQEPSGEATPSESQTPEILKVSQRSSKKTSRATKSSTDCHRCGGKHAPSTCKFKSYECNFCHKKGHLQSVCRKNKSQARHDSEPTARAHRIGEQESGDKSPEEYTLYRVNSGGSKPLTVDISLNGQAVTMEIDTGASVSLMSEQTFRLLLEKRAAIQPTNIKLSTYTGEAIQVVGTADVEVKQHNNQTVSLPLSVTRASGPTLLDCNWQHVFQVKTARTLQEVLDTYDEVFEGKLGKVKGVTAKIYIDPDATPCFFKARSVPYALQKKVEQELD